MIQGIASATATKERKAGFLEVMKAKFPAVKIIEGDDCGYNRVKARSYMESFLLRGEKIDCVYAHNDEMAIGARLAWDAANPSGGTAPAFVGIDGCQQEVVDMIKAGKLDATFKYPTPGAKGIEVAVDIIKGNPPKDKKIVLPTVLVTKDTADQYVKDNPNLAKWGFFRCPRRAARNEALAGFHPANALFCHLLRGGAPDADETAATRSASAGSKSRSDL